MNGLCRINQSRRRENAGGGIAKPEGGPFHISPFTLHSSKGFTLIELIMVVVLVGILSALGGMLIVTPIQSFTDLSRRAALVDIADNALQRMSRELRPALPNSVRITNGGQSLEFLNTVTGGRYRARREQGGGGNVLKDCRNDTFDVLDGVTAGVVSTGPAGQSNCMNGNGDCLVIYNTGTGPGDYNAYDGDNTATLTAVNAAADQMTCDNGPPPGWTGFPFPIPPDSQQRFYVVDMPVSYVCDLGAGTLRRYEDYGIQSAQPATDPDFGVAGDLLAGRLVGCNFSYVQGAGSRHGLVTLRVTVRDSGESVSLLHQVHVLNTP